MAVKPKAKSNGTKPKRTSRVQKQTEPVTEDQAYMDIGRTGLKRSGGYIQEEFLRELQGDKSVKVYQEMMWNEPVVAAILFSITMLIRSAGFIVESVSDQNEDMKWKFWLEGVFNDMSTTFEDLVSEILSFLGFGWHYGEIVYKIRKGKSMDPKFRSRFTDGKIGWRKIATRAQSSLSKWEFDEEGGVQAMTQMISGDGGGVFTIPIQKSLLFRTSVHKGNPEGLSILRGAYRPWYMKKHIENIEGIGIERDLAGLPVAKVPPYVLNSKAGTPDRTTLDAVKDAVINVRRDEQEGLVYPMLYDENGNELFSFELLSTGGTRQFDTTKIIQRYNQMIATTVLADFIFLGHSAKGSFALSKDKTQMFTIAIGAWMWSIAEVFNRHGIPRLWELNNFPEEAMPRLVPHEPEKIDLAELGQFVSDLAGAGMELFPDGRLENKLRNIAALPDKQEDMADFPDDDDEGEEEEE